MHQKFLSPKNFCKNSGFTFMELLLVMAIVAIFSAALAPFTINVLQRQIVREETISLKSTLRQTQAKAMKNMLGDNWGIYIEENQYTVFKGESFADRNSNYDRVVTAPSTVKFGEETEIVFKKNTGHLLNAERVEIKISSGREEKGIEINKQGKIDYTI